MPRRFIALLITFAALATACAQGGTGASPTTSPSAASRPITSPPAAPSDPGASASGAASDLDRAFIDMMVPHHQSAVEMARIAQERSEHEELISMADDIIAAQEAEIARLKAWRLEWFGNDDTPPMEAMPILPGVQMPGMGHDMGGQTMDMTMDIAMLESADPFDLAFLQAMMEHHQSAIDAAGIIVAETQLPELRTLAVGITSSQQAEIDQMESWLAEWYPATY